MAFFCGGGDVYQIFLTASVSGNEIMPLRDIPGNGYNPWSNVNHAGNLVEFFFRIIYSLLWVNLITILDIG